MSVNNESIPDSRDLPLPLQNRFIQLLQTIDTLVLPKDGSQLPLITKNYILGPEQEWPYKDFRQAAVDLELIQGVNRVYLKTYLPGNYWIYRTIYTRENIAAGEKLNGQSQGKFIYVPDFSGDFNPNPVEIGKANIILFHEASHQVNDERNIILYTKLLDKLSTIDPDEKKYLAFLRELHTRSELGALELLLKSISLVQQDGVCIFPGTKGELKEIILDGLRSQASFLNIELPL